jgi:hypothetical protein
MRLFHRKGQRRAVMPSKPVLLEREGVHSCTKKAIDYWRIAAIAASTPI